MHCTPSMLALASLIMGCAGRIEYKEVRTPVKCEIVKRERPIATGEIHEQIKEILIYTELLESDIKICKGE